MRRLGCGGVGGVGVWLGPVSGRVGWRFILCVVSLDSLWIWQVQVSVYCVWWIPEYLRCTQCSILGHLIDICFLTCICLSQIQTFLCVVVGPGLILTSHTFMRRIASHPAGPHGHLVKKTR